MGLWYASALSKLQHPHTVQGSMTQEVKFQASTGSQRHSRSNHRRYLPALAGNILQMRPSCHLAHCGDRRKQSSQVPRSCKSCVQSVNWMSARGGSRKHTSDATYFVTEYVRLRHHCLLVLCIVDLLVTSSPCCSARSLDLLIDLCYNPLGD